MERKFCFRVVKGQYNTILCRLPQGKKEIENIITTYKNKTVHRERVTSYFEFKDAPSVSAFMVWHNFTEVHEIIGEYVDKETIWENESHTEV